MIPTVIRPPSPVPARRLAEMRGKRSLRSIVALLCAGAAVLPAWNNAIAQEATEQEIEAAGDERATEINVKNADIGAIVRIFSKKTKRNYILDEAVKGKVTIYLPSKVNSEEAIRILDSVLALKGFSSVPIGDNIWKIVPAKQAKQSTIPTLTESGEGRPTAAMVTRLLNLKYVSADDVKQLLSQLISGDGLVNAYTGTNSLIMIDSEDNIERLVAIVNSLDVPFTDREMTIIPIVNAEANDIATKLNEILGTSGGGDKGPDDGGQSQIEAIRARLRENAEMMANRTSLAAGGTPPTTTGASAAAGLTGKTIAARAREPKIIADERTNSIIVVADEETTARIRALISELDSKVDLSGSKFYVYRCQHAKADDLAAVLSGLGGGSTSAGGSAGFGTDAISGGLDSSSGFGRASTRGTGSTMSSQGRLSSQQRTPGRSRSEGRSSQLGGGNFNLGENISITADPATNSLIISASKTDYEKIRALIEKLDIKRRQVLVEAMLLEVGVDQSQAMSTEFTTSTGGADGAVLAKTDFGNLTKLLADPTKLSNFSVAAASSGTIKLPGGISIPTQSVLLNAAKQNSNVNVLSAPNILATDNEQAEIVVGQNVPFLASTSTSETNLNNTFNQIDRQDVGITLRITPQISSGDAVTLKIFTEVSNVILATLASPLGPTTTVRTSETTVITKDAQMVVIGGLMSDDISEDESGVPFLADVPILGHMFRSVREAHKRTNLLIFITPRIIQDQYDARDVTIDQRDELASDIAARNIFPPRRDVLESPAIDRVTQKNEFDGPKPTTIRPLPRGTEVAPAPAAPIELKVSPRVPGQPARELNRPSGAPAAPAATAAPVEATKPTPSAPRAALLPLAEQYVILQMKEPQTLAEGLPFTAEPQKGLVGLAIPADPEAPARRFFRIGERYAYRLAGRDYEASPVGIFSEKTEVGEFFPELSTPWHVLSPHEIMNIGAGPWVKLPQ